MAPVQIPETLLSTTASRVRSQPQTAPRSRTERAGPGGMDRSLPRRGDYPHLQLGWSWTLDGGRGVA